MSTYHIMVGGGLRHLKKIILSECQTQASIHQYQHAILLDVGTSPCEVWKFNHTEYTLLNHDNIYTH